MAVYLDDQAVELDGSDLPTLLASAVAQLEPRGRVVIEVTLDGEPVVGDALAQPHAEAIQSGREVRLYTADTRELAQNVLTQLREQMEQARQVQSDAAELIQRDEHTQGMKKVAEALEIWQVVQEGVMTTLLLMQADADDMKVGDETFAQVVNSLVDQLKALRGLIVGGDVVGLADALAYEWPDTADRWCQVIDELMVKYND